MSLLSEHERRPLVDVPAADNGIHIHADREMPFTKVPRQQYCREGAHADSWL